MKSMKFVKPHLPEIERVCVTFRDPKKKRKSVSLTVYDAVPEQAMAEFKRLAAKATSRGEANLSG